MAQQAKQDQPVLNYQSQGSPEQKAAMKAGTGLWVLSFICIVIGGLLLLALIFAMANINQPGTSFHVTFAGSVDHSSSTAAKAKAFGEGFVYLALWMGFSGVGVWSASGVKRGSRRAVWVGIIWCGLILLVMADTFVEAMLGLSAWFLPATSVPGIVINWGVRGLLFGAIVWRLIQIERLLWNSRLYASGRSAA